MKARVSILFFLSLGVVIANAQTIKWLVGPNYASITHYSDDIFKCIDQNGKLQLLDWNGKSLDIPANADAVTDYSDGYALVLQGDKILGFLSETKPHTFQALRGDYYVTQYSFFSEGYVAVAQGSASGKQGYLDSKGSLVLDCQYPEVMPVRNGRALVWEKGKGKGPRYKRVEDWSSRGMNALKDGTSFTWATSFNTSGYALARLGNNKYEYVVIDVNFNASERDVKGNKDEVNELDYSYKQEGSAEVNAPANDKPKENGFYAFKDNAEFGFKSTNGKVVVPCQFGDAKDFHSGRAIVAMGGKYGIIELLDNLDAHWSVDHIRVYDYANKVEPLQFTLHAPSSLKSDQIALEIDKGDGHYSDCQGLRCEFFVVTGRGSTSCTTKARAVYKDNGFPDLLLWEGENSVQIDHVSINLSSPVATSEYADENDNQTVKAVVTNTSDIPVKVSAILNVAGKNVPFNGELKPNQSKTMSVTVKVTEDKDVNATVSAKVDGHNCGSKSSTISLRKI